MSRYTVVFGSIEYAYGYDEPLQEYFFEKCDSSIATEENEEGYIFQISSYYSMLPHPEYPDKDNWSKGDILDLVRDEERKLGRSIWHKEHLDALCLDLKF